MKRLYLTVEGQTEQAFARATLGPHLLRFDVLLHGPRLTGPHGRRGGRIPQGGMFNTFLHAIEDIRRWLKEDRSSDARFSMMVDLYGLPHDFPGYDEAMALNGGERQADSMEAALTAELQDDRFIPYLQVYEFEALVLCDVAKLNELHEEADRAIQRLAEKCSPFQSPEEIDHGRHSHPKARTKGAIPRYDENVHGPLIAGEIGLAVLREKCPHFGGWLRMLEELDR